MHHFQEEHVGQVTRYKEEHIKLAKAVHSIEPSIPSSVTANSGSKERLRRFEECFQVIKIALLEEERTNFAIGEDLRSSIIEHIKKRTNCNTFPFRGHVKKIGSSWDGSKLGVLDEVDTLYVLDEEDFKVCYFGKRACEFHIVWKGKMYDAQELNHTFANHLEHVLRDDTPRGLGHNGYAAPRFSGVRVSGPAVTVLYQTTEQIGNMEPREFLSVDITLALPFSCAKDTASAHEICTAIARWTKKKCREIKTKAMNIPKNPNFIACHINGTWKLTTARIEAVMFHELEENSSTKRAYVLLKCLNKKVDKTNFKDDLFQVGPKSTDLRDSLIKQIDACCRKDDNIDTDNLIKEINECCRKDDIDSGSLIKEIDSCCRNDEDIDRVNHCMRYGYVLLSPKERTHYNELPTKIISINTAAIKHILLDKSLPEDCAAEKSNPERVAELMRYTLEELARDDSFKIKNGIYPDFPGICKLSIWSGAAENVHEFAKHLLAKYEILTQSRIIDVSTLSMCEIVKNVTFIFCIIQAITNDSS